MNYYVEGMSIILSILLPAIFFWLVAIVIARLLKHDDILINRSYFISEFLLVTYIIILLRVTGLAGATWQYSGSISYNMIPFTKENLTLMFLNVLLFIPFGFLLPATFKNMRKLRVFIISVLSTILAIEMLQVFFIGRFFDVDDIIFNLIGSIIGYSLFIVGNKTIKWSTCKNYIISSTGHRSLIIAFSAIIIGMPVSGVTITDIVLYKIGICVFDYSFRISAVIPLTVSITGLVVGILNRKERGAKAGCCLSVIAMLIALMSISF